MAYLMRCNGVFNPNVRECSERCEISMRSDAHRSRLAGGFSDLVESLEGIAALAGQAEMLSLGGCVDSLKRALSSAEGMSAWILHGERKAMA